jgi:hypothetical protein
VRVRQRAARSKRIRRHDVWKGERRNIGKRGKRQAKTERRIAGQQEQPAGARRPRLANPATRITRRLGVPPLHREHIPGGFSEPALEDACEPHPSHRIVETIRCRIEILGQLPLLADEMPGVLVSRRDRESIDFETIRDALQELTRGVRGDAVVLVFLGDQGTVGPNRSSVTPPIERERPPRQLLSGIPLALTVMQ